MMFSSKQSNPFMRTVTGYTSADTSSNDGVERSVTNARFTDQTAKFEVGNKYTFSLEKTDEGYTAACNGSEQKLSDNSFTSVQEDGTVVVGIAVSRKVSVKVSDVEFSKSESKGIHQRQRMIQRLHRTEEYTQQAQAVLQIMNTSMYQIVQVH